MVIATQKDIEQVQKTYPPNVVVWVPVIARMFNHDKETLLAISSQLIRQLSNNDPERAHWFLDRAEDNIKFSKEYENEQE